MSADDPEKEELCKHEGWTSIKEKKRHSTDILLTLMLIACWVAMTAVGLVVTGVIESENLSKGRPELLINSMDYNARICGVDSGVTDKPYGYYMMDGSVVCVEECPGEYSILPSKFYCMDDDATKKLDSNVITTSNCDAESEVCEDKLLFTYGPIPDEPTLQSPSVVRISIKLPDGKKLVRKYDVSTTF